MADDHHDSRHFRESPSIVWDKEQPSATDVVRATLLVERSLNALDGVIRDQFNIFEQNAATPRT